MRILIGFQWSTFTKLKCWVSASDTLYNVQWYNYGRECVFVCVCVWIVYIHVTYLAFCLDFDWCMMCAWAKHNPHSIFVKPESNKLTGSSIKLGSCIKQFLCTELCLVQPKYCMTSLSSNISFTFYLSKYWNISKPKKQTFVSLRFSNTRLLLNDR